MHLQGWVSQQHKAQVRGIGIKREVAALVHLSDIDSLNRARFLEAKIKKQTGSSGREFVGHISLAYFVNYPFEDESRFDRAIEVLRGFEEELVGDFNIDNLDLTYFSSMNRFIPLLHKNLLSGEVTVNKGNLDQVKAEIKDLTKPREGRSEAEVVAEATGIITSGRVNDGHIWTIVDETTPWVAAVLAYYEATNQQEKAAKLRELIKAGHVRAGPMAAAYGAHVIVEGQGYILIATNNNPSLDSTLVHESNLGTHEENLTAEKAYQNGVATAGRTRIFAQWWSAGFRCAGKYYGSI